MEHVYETRKLSENKIFRPSLIPTHLPDVVEIIGRGSIGKSTLANMISVGSHGNDDEKIHPILRRKLRLLMNPEYQELTFRFELKSANGDIIVISEKQDPKSPEIKIIEYIDGKINDLSCVEDFQKEIVLIHVTPIGPNNIIHPMIQRVEERQRKITRRLKTFISYIQEAINQSDNERADRITELKKQNASYEEQSSLLSGKIKYNDDKLRLLMSAAGREGLKHCENEIKKILPEIKRIDEEIGLKGDNILDGDKNYSKTQKEIKDKLSKLESQFVSTTNQLRALLGDNSSLDSWEKISFDKIEVDLAFDTEIKKLITQFQHDITKMKEVNKYPMKEIEYYQRLKSDSAAYETFLNVKIPGTDLTITEFIEAINKSLKKHDELIKNKSIMEDCMTNLRELRNKVIDLEELLKKFKKLQEMNDRKNNIKEIIDIEKKQEYLRGLKTDLEYVKNRQKAYLQIMENGKKHYNDFGNENCKIGKDDLIEYRETSPEGLLKAIQGIQELIIKQTSNLESVEELESKNNAEIKSLEGQTPSPWEGCYEELNNLLQATRSLATRFDEMNIYVDNVSSYNDGKEETTDLERSNYYDALFSYFAKIRPNIRHNRKDYEIIRIDPNGFTSKDGVRIDFNDMGGSEGQTTFLENELNLPDDGRKIILLCDEAGNMDAIGLDNLREKMKKLRNENRLLFGAIIRAQGDQEKIDTAPEIFNIMDGNKI